MKKRMEPTIAPRVPYGPPIEDALRQGDMKALRELLDTVNCSLEALAKAEGDSLSRVEGALTKESYALLLEALKTIRGAIAPNT